MTKIVVQEGSKIGRWTVLNACGEGAQRKWWCRCECGTERAVLERALSYGGSKSCGCLTRERRWDAEDLTGRTFGELRILERASTPEGRSGRWWKCLCSCGKEVQVQGTLLRSGRKTHCGCKTQKKSAHADIAGRSFNALTALYPLKSRSKGGNVMWQCRCECGSELAVSYNDLLYSNTKSCGCRKKEHNQEMKNLLTHVAGTSIEHLRSQKKPKNNTTGVRGVYLIKGKYVAKIVFQKKPYYLGAYRDLADAAEARREAEEAINDQVTAYYERWRTRAESDPDWAAENPVHISVERRDGRLALSILPELDV